MIGAHLSNSANSTCAVHHLAADILKEACQAVDSANATFMAFLQGGWLAETRARLASDVKCIHLQC